MSGIPGVAGRARAVRAVLIAGLTAGALDITAAFGFYGLRGANGLPGAAAYTGGAPTAIFGALLHFSIATVAAGAFYWFSRRLTVLVRRPVGSGASYGVAVYLFMNHLVVPLSAAPKRPFVLGTALAMVVIHIVCVGSPIAFAIRRFSEPYSGRG